MNNEDKFFLEKVVRLIIESRNELSKKKTIEFIDKGVWHDVANLALPKQSKQFSTNLTKIIFSKESTRERVILAHLFFEGMMEEIIKEKIPKPEKILEDSFVRKLDLLYSLGYISEINFTCLKLINNIRNNFAHNLKYNVVEFDIKKFPFLKKLKILDFKRIKEKERYYDFLISFCLWWSMISLESEHSCISLMDY